MALGINTDYLSDVYKPEYYLALAADAGFTHIHWCHQWNSDFIYSDSEIAFYKKSLHSLGLVLQDVHATVGQEKLYFSDEEYRRKAGLELLVNRIRMFAELEGTGAVALHIPSCRKGLSPEAVAEIPAQMVRVRRTLDELMPYLEKYDCAIALENMPNEDFECIAELMDAYPAERVGITYDSGHGNCGSCRGLDNIDKWKHRLKVLHLHDNDGSRDLHQPPFYGTVDWERAVRIIAGSGLTNLPLSFELSMVYTGYFDQESPKHQQDEKKIRAFLADAFERCSKVNEMFLKKQGE